MAVMDEFKNEREKMKDKPRKEQLAYFWDYYKWYVIGIAFALILVFSYVRTIVTAKDTALYAVMLNSVEGVDSTHAQDFSEYSGISLDDNEFYFDTTMVIHEDDNSELTYSYMQKLMAYTAAGELDVLVTSDNTFRQYAYNENFHDLRDILTPEQLEKYAPYIYYIDYKVVLANDAAVEAWDQSYVPVYPDPTNPDEMEDPIPVGIYVDSSENITQDFAFETPQIVLGFYVTTQRLDNALLYLDYLMQ